MNKYVSPAGDGLIHALDPAYPSWATIGAKELCGASAGFDTTEIYLGREPGDGPVEFQRELARVNCEGCRALLPPDDLSPATVERWLLT